MLCWSFQFSYEDITHLEQTIQLVMQETRYSMTKNEIIAHTIHRLRHGFPWWKVFWRKKSTLRHEITVLRFQGKILGGRNDGYVWHRPLR